MYTPNPIDISDVELTPELLALSEVISHNVHEVWSQTRIGQGWTYGSTRNDALKQHPSLIPYECLTEEEKDLDRNTAISTLKLITKLGFEIKKI